jgi:hypothetical protein
MRQSYLPKEHSKMFTRKGEECVCKEFKTGSVFEESYFNNELADIEPLLLPFNQSEAIVL